MASVQETSPNTPLNLAIALFAPISSISGSPTIFFLQPVLTGKVFASTAVLLGTEIFLLLANYFFGLEGLPVLDMQDPTRTVKMSVHELQDFLRTLSNNSGLSGASSQPYSQPGIGLLSPTQPKLITPLPPEAPVVFGLAIFSGYTNVEFSPTAWLFFPVFSFPGLRGAIPMLLLATIATIFVRAVVPPETTGAKPLSQAASPPNMFQLTTEQLFQLLNRFGKHFSNQ